MFSPDDLYIKWNKHKIMQNHEIQSYRITLPQQTASFSIIHQKLFIYIFISLKLHVNQFVLQQFDVSHAHGKLFPRTLTTLSLLPTPTTPPHLSQPNYFFQHIPVLSLNFHKI